jgi:hypothetical protein
MFEADQHWSRRRRVARVMVMAMAMVMVMVMVTTVQINGESSGIRIQGCK